MFYWKIAKIDSKKYKCLKNVTIYRRCPKTAENHPLKKKKTLNPSNFMGEFYQMFQKLCPNSSGEDSIIKTELDY